MSESLHIAVLLVSSLAWFVVGRASRDREVSKWKGLYEHYLNRKV